jgi:hypothetical protein
MSQQTPIEMLLQELELSLLQPSVRKSERVAELLAEDFVEFGSSGRVFSKAQIIASLQAESPSQVTVSQFTVQLLAAKVALVTYHAHRHSEPPVHTLRSSIWEQKKGLWQIIFHQGTLVAAPQ